MHVGLLIIGGGISGLATAYYASRAGLQCWLVEKRPRLGGVILTEEIDGCIVEGGPDGFLSVKPWARELIEELGLGQDLIGSNDDRRLTFIVRQGRLVPLPEGLLLMVPTRVWPVLSTRLFSWRTKLRIALEVFREPARVDHDRSVAEFVQDHYGEEVVDYLAEPLLAGVYGGDARLLSAESVLPEFVHLERRHGSLTLGAWHLARARSRTATPLFQSLRQGMGCLVRALEARARPNVRIIHAEAETIHHSAEGYQVRIGGDWISARSVVVACPAWEAAQLVEQLDGELATILRSIPYTSSVTVVLGYDAAQVPEPTRGFGFLIPRVEGHSLIAATWVGVKYSHRSRQGLTLLRCFLGGARDTGVTQRSDGEILQLVERELAQILGLHAAPRFVRIYRWPLSMAQYTVGHRDRVARLERALLRWPRLHLIGNGYYGVGIPDCVRLAKAAAQQVVESTAVRQA